MLVAVSFCGECFSLKYGNVLWKDEYVESFSIFGRQRLAVSVLSKILTNTKRRVYVLFELKYEYIFLNYFKIFISLPCDGLAICLGCTLPRTINGWIGVARA